MTDVMANATNAEKKLNTILTNGIKVVKNADFKDHMAQRVADYMANLYLTHPGVDNVMTDILVDLNSLMGGFPQVMTAEDFISGYDIPEATVVQMKLSDDKYFIDRDLKYVSTYNAHDAITRLSLFKHELHEDIKDRVEDAED